MREFVSAGLLGAIGAQAGMEGLVLSFPPGVSLLRFGAIASRQFQRDFSLSKPYLGRAVGVLSFREIETGGNVDEFQSDQVADFELYLRASVFGSATRTGVWCHALGLRHGRAGRSRPQRESLRQEFGDWHSH